MATQLVSRRKTDRWALRLPLLGRIFQLSDLFQAGNLIGTLLESGINTTETLRLTERTIKNTDLRERFNTAHDQINEESLALAQAFQAQYCRLTACAGHPRRRRKHRPSRPKHGGGHPQLPQQPSDKQSSHR